MSKGHVTSRERAIAAAARALIIKIDAPLDPAEDIFGEVETIDDRNTYIDRQARRIAKMASVSNEAWDQAAAKSAADLLDAENDGQ